jgi:hypothetical protein
VVVGQPSSALAKVALVSGGIAAATGIGALLGMLVGMSTAPVVANLVATFTAAAVAFLGLRGSATAPVAAPGAPAPAAAPASSNTLHIRIAAFAIAAIAGILVGVYIRAHDLFSPTAAQRVRAWQEAGVPRRDAVKLLMFREGIVPEGWKVDPKHAPTTQSLSVLYSATVEEWEEADPKRWGNKPDKSVENWTARGGQWKALAETVKTHVPSDQQQQAFTELHAALRPPEE